MSEELVNVEELANKARLERVRNCEKEMNEVLQKYECTLQTLQVWKNGIPEGIQVVVVSLK
jgi:hypothetical protein